MSTVNKKNSKIAATTSGPGYITINTGVSENGEVLHDDYNNLVSTLVHENEHSSGGKSDRPFTHFDVGKTQFSHSSFGKTTDNFKDFFKGVMSKYLTGQKKELSKMSKDSDNYQTKLDSYQSNSEWFNRNFGNRN